MKMSPVVSIALDDKEFSTTFARDKIVSLLDVLNVLATSASEMVITFKKIDDSLVPHNVVVNDVGQSINSKINITNTLLENGKAVHIPINAISPQLQADAYNSFTISHDGIYYNDVKALAVDLIAATSRAYVTDVDMSSNGNKLIKLLRSEKNAVIEADKSYAITVANVFTSIDTKLINVVRAASAIGKCERQLGSTTYQNVAFNYRGNNNNYAREIFNEYILGEITADFAVSKIALQHRVNAAKRLEELQKQASDDKKCAYKFANIDNGGLAIQSFLDMLVFNGIEFDGRIFTTQVGRIKLTIPVNATSHWPYYGIQTI